MSYKVVLLGEGRVGKTSLISRFVNDKFDSDEVSTVQASMYTKKKVVIEGKAIDLSIWDTAGQERFHALGPIYYRNSNGAVLVYDITDADTFEKVKMWIKELKAVVGESISIVICGNKCDMEKERDIDESIAEKYARKENALHFNTSAKLNKNVSEAFEALAAKIAAQEGLLGGSLGGSKKKKKGLRIGDGPTAEEASSELPTDSKSSSSAYTSASVGGYDDYDDKPQAAESQPQQSSKRKNTIILSEPKKQQGGNVGEGDTKPSGGASAKGGESQGGKKKGCCN